MRMQSMANPETLCVTLVYAPQPRTVLEKQLHVAVGSTARDALQVSGWHSRPEVRELLEKGGDAAQLQCGIWGKPCGLEHVLQTGDRLELYRPLLVDPKRARRERFARQGSRSAGLFARRRTPTSPTSGQGDAPTPEGKAGA